MNKSFLNSLSLFSIVLCGLFIFIPNYAKGVTNVTQMENKTNVAVDKVWKIKFNQGINKDKLNQSIAVYNPIGIPASITISYDAINNTITVKPPDSGYIPGQTYSLQIGEKLRDLNDNSLKAPVIKNFTIAVPDNGPLIDTVNKKYVYKQYDNTLDQMVDTQFNLAPVNLVTKYTLYASNIDVYEYMNPKNFENHDYALYQFLTLNYVEGITAEELDNILVGKGILEGQGKTFLDACELYNINPAYIIAHALLETGNGTSVLANGVDVTEVDGKPVPIEMKTYNMFGIGAFDTNPCKFGSERAYTEGWCTPEIAIEGGIKWIADKYINNIDYKQNTLYKMRWNPEITENVTYRHQYATDIAWAYKQSYRIKEILDKCTNANLVFEIPQYK
ncbi:MAG: beta-N-acetylglucosaminidase [Clostridium sp.]|jgi:beta-N-acetylglucosaminidase